MSMKTMDLVKGIAIGMAAATAICALTMPPKKKTCKSVIAGALRSAGDTVENIACMMGL